MSTGVSFLMLLRLIVMLVMVLAGSWLLRALKATPRIRTLFVIGGVLVLGFGFGFLGRGLDPNPVLALRTLLRTALARRGPPSPAVVPALVGLMLVMGAISNKAVCGWACQLGLLQDALHRAGTPKIKVRFRVSNSVRVAAFVTLVGGLALAGFDWIGLVDPFRVFRLDLAPAVAALVSAVLAGSVFFYRPWCRFLCPFGLLSWMVEQVSVLRPRIDRETCLECEQCVVACPTGAMKGFYNGARIRPDCYACGSCLSACPTDGAIGWRTAKEARSDTVGSSARSGTARG